MNRNIGLFHRPDVYKRQALKSIGSLHNLETIGKGAFNGCSALEHVDDLYSLTRLEYDVFSHCVSSVSYTHLDVYKRQRIRTDSGQALREDDFRQGRIFKHICFYGLQILAPCHRFQRCV